MKTLTDLVCIIIEMMDAKEQDAFLETMARRERPTKRPVPMTAGEIWWRDRLSPQRKWITLIAVDDLVDDFIKGTGWKDSRHGAATSMGMMLKTLCPAIRRRKGKYLMPAASEAREAFTDVFPAPKKAGQASGEPEYPYRPPKAIMLD